MRTLVPPTTEGTAAQDAPRHWSRIGEATCVWGIWCLYAVHRLLGRAVFRVALYPVVVYYWLARPVARRASLDYLRRRHRAMGGEGSAPGARQTLRHVYAFAETLLDKLLAISGRYPFDDVAREGVEALERQLETGHGGIIVTAHMGCLELCRALAQKRAGLRLTVLVHTAHAERFNRMLSKLDADSTLQLLQIDDITPATAQELNERVNAGEFIAIAGDRIPVHGGRTVRVPFLGAPAQFPIGPYVLAALLDCPLFAMGCIRQGKGHLLRFTELARTVALPRARRTEALTVHASAYAAWLEGMLAQSPYDWFNFYDFWASPDNGAAGTHPSR